MTGQRIANNHNFECEALSNKTIEYCSAFYTNKIKDDLVMLILKLEGITLYQRFFLDAGIGFWEEWSTADTFYDLGDLAHVNLAKELGLLGKKLCSIKCKGSFEVLSSIEFIFEKTILILKFSDNTDIESNVVLEKL